MPAEAPSTPSGPGRIADNIVHFARVLRRAGLPVGPGSVVDAIRAVEVAGIASREDFYWTLHSVLVKKREHRAVFLEAFEIFWRRRGLLEKLIAMMSPAAPPRAAEPERPRAGSARVNEALRPERTREIEQPETEIDARLTVSDREVLQRKDFAQMTAGELAAAKREIARLAMPDDRVRTRRLKAALRGAFDPRLTMRASLRLGGGMILPRFRAPTEVQPPLVALCDISGSMTDYSRVLLHFLHAISERRKVSVFLFGTRLTNVTRQLRMKDPDEALAGCADAVADWSGGTRIASALRTFNRDWSRRVLGQGAIVLLITDGLERDADADLGREMDRLRRSCRTLIWLNPLLRFSGFEARASGIRAMLPHVDQFRPAHSLQAIADVVDALSTEPGGAAADPRSYLKAA
ncbi:vWA domain-containing protein [Faunimonas sp. B44]|uniref:vWA domain-containing protein n=1 Tax=Faunimonas sp. B44 TaxID=3461493 RepID=UPI004043E9D4